MIKYIGITPNRCSSHQGTYMSYIMMKYENV